MVTVTISPQDNPQLDEARREAKRRSKRSGRRQVISFRQEGETREVQVGTTTKAGTVITPTQQAPSQEQPRTLSSQRSPLPTRGQRFAEERLFQFPTLVTTGFGETTPTAKTTKTAPLLSEEEFRKRTGQNVGDFPQGQPISVQEGNRVVGFASGTKRVAKKVDQPMSEQERRAEFTRQSRQIPLSQRQQETRAFEQTAETGLGRRLAGTRAGLERTVVNLEESARKGDISGRVISGTAAFGAGAAQFGLNVVSQPVAVGKGALRFAGLGLATAAEAPINVVRVAQGKPVLKGTQMFGKELEIVGESFATRPFSTSGQFAAAQVVTLGAAKGIKAGFKFASGKIPVKVKTGVTKPLKAAASKVKTKVNVRKRLDQPSKPLKSEGQIEIGGKVFKKGTAPNLGKAISKAQVNKQIVERVNLPSRRFIKKPLGAQEALRQQRLSRQAGLKATAASRLRAEANQAAAIKRVLPSNKKLLTQIRQSRPKGALKSPEAAFRSVFDKKGTLRPRSKLVFKRSGRLSNVDIIRRFNPDPLPKGTTRVTPIPPTFTGTAAGTGFGTGLGVGAGIALGVGSIGLTRPSLSTAPAIRTGTNVRSVTGLESTLGLEQTPVTEQKLGVPSAGLTTTLLATTTTTVIGNTFITRGVRGTTPKPPKPPSSLGDTSGVFSYGFGRRPRIRQPKRSRPSLTAQFLGIKAKSRAERAAGEFTGLTIRGL